MTFIQGKREVSPLPILWKDKASSFPLSLLLLICLPAVTCHNLPCCNFCLQYGQSFAWDGQAWWFCRVVLRQIVCPRVCVHWIPKYPYANLFKGLCVVQVQCNRIAYFILHFYHCWEGICSTALDSTTATALAAQPNDSSPGFSCTSKCKYNFQVIDNKHRSHCILEVCRTSAFITKLFFYTYLRNS